MTNDEANDGMDLETYGKTCEFCHKNVKYLFENAL